MFITEDYDHLYDHTVLLFDDTDTLTKNYN